MRKSILKTIGICLLLCITVCAINVFAAEGDVEIKFAVGDSTLSINGEDVTVTTPYVVDGTTLVPVRVITEAFGAEVLWNGGEKSVTVNYRDVVIKLAIGSKTAYINDNATELLAAPELTNSTTMLPLRFITESFGADVTYDEATAKITVVKEMTISNSIRDYSLILKRSNKEMIGDSYLKWSMVHSPEVKLSYRSFDGTANTFTNDDETGIIDIRVTYVEEGETIDDVYAYYREMSQNYAVSKFEKAKAPSGADYVVIRYSTPEGYYERRTYISGENSFSILTALDSEGKREKFDALTDITATFDLKYDSAKTEDLSDVDSVTGNHTYSSDYFALEIDVPGYLRIVELPTKKNDVSFLDLEDKNTITYMHIGMYSSYTGHTAKFWAEKDYKGNKAAIAEKFASFGSIREEQIGGKKAYVYQYYTSRPEDEEEYVTYDMFIEAGSYFYNIAISGKKGRADGIKNAICDSIVFKEIDAEKTGQLIRTDDSSDIIYKDYKLEIEDVTFRAPTTWTDLSENKSMVFLLDEATARGVSVKAVYKKDIGSLNHVGFSKQLYEGLKYDKTVKLIEDSPKKSTENAKPTYCIKYMMDTAEGNILYHAYIFNDNNRYVVVILNVPEYSYGTKTQEIFEEIISSVDYD